MKNWFPQKTYRLSHWFFQWVSDFEGDIGIKIAGVIVLLKYKEHTLVYRVGSKKYKACRFCPAAKYQGQSGAADIAPETASW